jgi:hypothetical protein
MVLFLEELFGMGRNERHRTKTSQKTANRKNFPFFWKKACNFLGVMVKY